MNPFEEMRIFAQVMESGSFTAAADKLGLSKQFVSRKLMELEQRLGVRLLNRSTRRLDVTPWASAITKRRCACSMKSNRWSRASAARPASLAVPFASAHRCLSPWRTWAACCRCFCSAIRASASRWT
ncbi:LysR family transcriptional regulator [Pseudomonas sp. NA13]